VKFSFIRKTKHKNIDGSSPIFITSTIDTFQKEPFEEELTTSIRRKTFLVRKKKEEE